MSNLEISEAHRTEIEDEIHQWFVEAERELSLPQDWIQKFGKWEQFRSFVDDLAFSHAERQEELEREQERNKLYRTSMIG